MNHTTNPVHYHKVGPHGSNIPCVCDDWRKGTLHASQAVPAVEYERVKAERDELLAAASALEDCDYLQALDAHADAGHTLTFAESACWNAMRVVRAAIAKAEGK
jgi:hypothetical protein